MKLYILFTKYLDIKPSESEYDDLLGNLDFEIFDNEEEARLMLEVHQEIPDRKTKLIPYDL